MNKITRLDHADGKPRSYPAATLLADLVFPCGQVPVTAEGTTPETIAEQTVLCLDNLESTLVRAGSSLDAILQITVYLAAIDDFEAYDEARRGGSVLYKLEEGSHPVSELPGKKIVVIETNTAIFGAFGGQMFELTDRLKNELYGHVEASSDSGSDGSSE